MRRPGLITGLALLTLAVARGRSCGPFFAEIVFVAHQPPSHSAVMEGSPGLLWPDVHHVDLMLFYRRLNGPPFTPAEIAQVKAAEAQLATSQAPEDYQHPTPPPGLDAWVHASTAPATDNPSGLDHSVPGSQWQTYPNCLDDAFLTAARTLRERQASYANDQASLTEWIAGQNAVFSNCGTAGQMPATLETSRPLWLRQDRAYQQAAAHFYRAEWTPATESFRAIAADPASPWQEIAPYLIGRTLLRQAALAEQVAPVPNATNATVTAPAPTFDPRTLAQAQTQLQSVAAAHTRYSTPAQALVDFIQLRLNPDQAAARLALAFATGKEQNLNQSLTDLDYLLDNPDPKRPIGPANDLIDWIQTTREDVPGYPKHALDRWHQTHAIPWLATALLLTPSSQTTHPDPELLAAAKALPPTSPAWATITYQRLRLEPDNNAARAELTRLLPMFTREQSLSTTNAFRELLAHRAATPSAFLALAATKPVASDWGDGNLTPFLSEPPVDPHPSYFAGQKVNGNDPAFTPYTALILNQQLPLDALVSLIQEKTLPRQLQFQLVLATWTRAVLLHRDDLAHALTPEMIAGEPGWTPWLTAYDQATEPADRKAAALLALMRFPSVRPYVNAGGARSLGFVGYSEYRDNWWCAGMGEDSNADSDNSFADGYNYVHSSSPTAASPPKPVPTHYLPDFITPSLEQEARRDQLALLQIGDAPAYFGRETLAWVRAHPTDPRAPELLGFAYRAMRNGCNLEASNALRLEIFNLLHSHYPQSTWARQFKTFDPHADR